MAHLYRLAIASLLTLFALSAHAFEAWSVNYGDRVGRGTSAADACSQLIGAKYQATTGVNTVDAASMDGDLCNYTYTSSWGAQYNGGGTVTPVRGPDTACPNPYDVEQGGACVPRNCNPGQIRVNGFCVSEPPCDTGYTRVAGKCKKNNCQAGPAGDYTDLPDQVTYLCEQSGGQSCLVRVKPDICVSFNGSTSCSGAGRFTGASCTGGGDGGSAPQGPGGGDTGGNTGGGTGGTGGNTGGGTGGTGGNTGGGTGGTGGGTGGTGGSTGGGTGGTGGGTGGNTGGGTGGDTGGGGPRPVTPGDESGVLPPPDPKPKEPDGSCPAGYSQSGRFCIQNPTQPDGDGTCPSGTVKIGDSCVYTQPGGGGTGGGSGGGGGGDGDGEGEEEQSGFGGACVSGFSCEGDAIQCAIAQEQHRRACKLFDDESAESKLYNDNKGKEGKQTNDLPGNESVSFLGRISMNDLLGGGGQCTNDVNVVVMGQAITLPFTKICPAIAVIGNIMVAVSLLLAARILTRG